ncbi:interleukin-1 receptor-associated kinase 4-like [Sipha flava]|uniref:non-specific serine/threonine protein kinase n=1 Tax=Sipha flava TaxID=143950 RepID=A0A8B8F8K5_9HEMI|nr:interleukin-1 receptor-associated kinase 4-like [Sipha flava]
MTEATTEVRKMDPALRFDLINLLNINEGWKTLMTKVTVDCNPNNNLKYTYDHVKLIENASKLQQRFCSEIFLEEWGTSGKIRPNLQTLMNLLYEVNLIRAAEAIASKISKDCMTTRMTSFKNILENDENTDDYSNSENFRPTILNTSLTLKNIERFDEIRIPYETLYHATNGFSDSCLIGSGGYSKVFKAELNNRTVAIKRMEKVYEERDIKQYLNEIDNILKFKHVNLLPLLAISEDKHPCIVYEFMENGSLLDCIACKERSSLLNWKLRIKLGIEVASGLVYLHTAFETPIIHRDIKTANILLDKLFVAKIGDFGLTRIGDNTMTSEGKGTSAYMSPEAFRGDVSVKLDVFSFGVVLLELLTGLPPFDEFRQHRDLLTHIIESESPIEDLPDKRAGDWNKMTVEKIYELAKLCTLVSKSKRPFMYGERGVYVALEKIQSEIDGYVS